MAKYSQTTLTVTSDSVPASTGLVLLRDWKSVRVYVAASGSALTLSSFFVDPPIEAYGGLLSAGEGYKEVWATPEALTDGKVAELAQPAHVATAKLNPSFLVFEAVLDAAGDPGSVKITVVGE